MRSRAITVKTIALLSLAIIAIVAAALWWVSVKNSNAAVLDERWATWDNSSTDTIDHSTWQLILDDYLVTDVGDGVNLFDYAGLIDDDRTPLDNYIAYLTGLDPLTLTRAEQMAFWFNLYNAATVQLILDNYPVKSITQLGSNPTEFGPWNEDAVVIDGVALSLNDIEHRIIRPLYNDYRIHFAVNCASIGCPNLAPVAFTAADLDNQLDAAARDYLTHPRGIDFQGSSLTLSTLFEWYADDFGANLSEVLLTLSQHTDEQTAKALTEFTGKPTYYYDWSLNGYCSIDDECGDG